MVKGDKKYNVLCDGEVITVITLTPEQYLDQDTRDFVKKAIASEYNVPHHYFRLQQAVWSKYRWDKEKQTNVPIGE